MTYYIFIQNSEVYLIEKFKRYLIKDIKKTPIQKSFYLIYTINIVKINKV